MAVCCLCAILQCGSRPRVSHFLSTQTCFSGPCVVLVRARTMHLDGVAREYCRKCHKMAQYQPQNQFFKLIPRSTRLSQNRLSSKLDQASSIYLNGTTTVVPGSSGAQPRGSRARARASSPKWLDPACSRALSTCLARRLVPQGHTHGQFISFIDLWHMPRQCTLVRPFPPHGLRLCMPKPGQLPA